MVISAVSDVKNLGLIFDRNMTMKKQINNMCKSAYYNSNNITRIRKSLYEDDTKSLVKTLVLPHLDYGNGLLIGISKNLENKTQLAQNYAVRLIKKLHKYDHITDH